MCWRFLDGGFSGAKVQWYPIQGRSTQPSKVLRAPVGNSRFKTAILDVG